MAVPGRDAGRPGPSGPSIRRTVGTAALAALVVSATVLGLLYLTGTGPFAEIEPSGWALDMTQVSALHERGRRGTGVVICLVDTGVDLAHPELRHVDLVGWRDLVGNLAEPYDDEGHGTAMAGIIFAGSRLPGIAPGAGLIAVKAIRADASGSDLVVAWAVKVCLDPDEDGDDGDGADVISISLEVASSPFIGSLTEAEVRNAIRRGVYVVASAGNDGQRDNGDVESPASVEGVIAVGAVDRRGAVAPFSSRGRNGASFPLAERVDPNRKPELVAPGVDIATILPGERYAYISGTSPATAIVSGVLALLLEEHPSYRRAAGDRVAAMKAALAGAAMPQDGRSGHDDRYGYGLVQAHETSVRL